MAASSARREAGAAAGADLPCANTTPAPTASNSQTWRWLVVDDSDKRQALADIYRKGALPYLNMGFSAPAEHAEQSARVRDSALWLAENLEKQGKSAEAEQHFRNNASQTPHSAAAQGALADFLVRNGRLKEAAGYYSNAVHLQPNDTRLKQGYAEVLMKTGATAEAIQVFRDVCGIEKTNVAM